MENECAWHVPAAQLLANNCNLDLKNPSAKQDLKHLSPEAVLDSIMAKEQKIAAIMAEIRATLNNKL